MVRKTRYRQSVRKIDSIFLLFCQELVEFDSIMRNNYLKSNLFYISSVSFESVHESFFFFLRSWTRFTRGTAVSVLRLFIFQRKIRILIKKNKKKISGFLRSHYTYFNDISSKNNISGCEFTRVFFFFFFSFHFRSRPLTLYPYYTMYTAYLVR